MAGYTHRKGQRRGRHPQRVRRMLRGHAHPAVAAALPTHPGPRLDVSPRAPRRRLDRRREGRPLASIHVSGQEGVEVGAVGIVVGIDRDGALEAVGAEPVVEEEVLLPHRALRARGVARRPRQSRASGVGPCPALTPPAIQP